MDRNTTIWGHYDGWFPSCQRQPVHKKTKQWKFSYFIIQRMRFSFPNLFSSFLTQKSLSSCVKWTESSCTNTEAVSPESFHSWTRHADCLPASEAIRRRRRLAGESSRISVSDKQAVTAGVSASLFPRRMLSRSLVTKLPPLHDYKNPQMRNYTDSDNLLPLFENAPSKKK